MRRKFKLILTVIIIIVVVIFLSIFLSQRLKEERSYYTRAIISSITDVGYITNITPPRTIVLSLNKFGAQTIEIDEGTEILIGRLGAVCNYSPCPESSFDPIFFNDLKVGQHIGITGELDALSKLKVKRIIYLP